MSKHTNAPWPKPYYGNADHVKFSCWEIDGICRVWDEHNASLIAAAPELLRELRNAIAQLEMAGDCIESGRYNEALLHCRSLMRPKYEAIAKATGADQ